MISINNKKIFTVRDIYQLPDHIRAELFHGRIRYMPMTTTSHQEILMQIFTQIYDQMKQFYPSYELYPGRFAVFIKEDELNYVEPDISVICNTDKLNDYGCLGAPDWIIEIVLPEDRSIDYFQKLFLYHSAGVREYWIVDYEKLRAIVYDFKHEKQLEYNFEDLVPSACVCPDISVNFADIDYYSKNT